MAVNGLNILVWRDGELIAGTRSNDIGTDCELLPISSPQSGIWRNFKAGRKNWSVTVNYLLSNVGCLTDLLSVGNEYTLMAGADVQHMLSGSAICQTCRITATVGNLVQGTFQFIGTGALSAVNP